MVEESVIWVEGVALAVGACGMWKEKEDGGRGVDYLPG